MLLNLHVKNLALIDEIEVDFQSGLNILTGETGAGKSIILGSVHLALGGRYSKDMIRKDADFGLVELLFSVDHPAIEKELEQFDIFPENHQILLSRKLMENRSISRINGETVNMATLRDVASLLIDIHGQHDHESLLHKKNHLTLLDNFAKDTVVDLKKLVADEYRIYKECEKNLSEARMDDSEKQRELSLLEYEIQEIEDAELQVGEDEELETQYRRMVNGRKISECVRDTYQYTGSSDGASDFLGRGVRSLSTISDLDERGKELYLQLSEVDSLLNDFNRELADYEDSFDFSEEDFQKTQERLNQLNYLKSKYGNEIDDILNYYDERCKRQNEIADYDAYIAKLNAELAESEKRLEKACTQLSKIRQKEAVVFTREIKQGLIDLHFLDVQFEMRFQTSGHYSANGIDETEFYISTNPGEELHPLGSTASGGELSRIMLAIKTVMAEKEDTPTLIFDEIDTGISGITAGKVANQMNLIAASHQVICITHLPQIAAMADAHFYISKDAVNRHTKTSIHLLDEAASIQELGRMIGGESITAAVLQSAKEMKKKQKNEE
ncbi:MAG: DNA repair protein RecN [Hespellia sp.]|nr:DNA repair protein RecN [Hespellia sp.]